MSANCWREANPHNVPGGKQSASEATKISQDGAATKEETARDEKPPDWLSPDADWTKSIDHLRSYSNYLSPKVGLFSADT